MARFCYFASFLRRIALLLRRLTSAVFLAAFQIVRSALRAILWRVGIGLKVCGVMILSI